MAADLAIHIRTKDIDDDVFEVFFSNTLGSKYCKGLFFTLSLQESRQAEEKIKKKYGKETYEIMENLPHVYIGEVSWLKAGLTEDYETYIPDTIDKINEIFEDHPIITDEVIEQVKAAYELKNKTSYDVSSSKNVIKFLEEYKGCEAFTISW
jgi:hypothetical protein